MLPIGPDAVELSSNLMCGPKNPLQTRSDQAAVFSANLRISSYYLFFASPASYVTYFSDVDHDLQATEARAALNQVKVKDAANRALHALFLESLGVTYGSSCLINL